MKCECGATYDITDFIQTDGTTNRPYDRVIGHCPKCKTVINTKYDPRDWWTERQLKVIKKLIIEVSGCQLFERKNKE